MESEGSLRKTIAVAVMALIVVATPQWWWAKVFQANFTPYMDEMEYGVYFQGSDFEDKMAAEANTEESCMTACRENSRCKAMSFVLRPWGGGECRLKDSVPRRYPAVDAISSVKISPL
jgi:PAN domain